jgi:hypothetical protein
MIGSFWQSRHSAGGKKGFDHVGENGACLGQVVTGGAFARLHVDEPMGLWPTKGMDATPAAPRRSPR